jgi:hypothetical protein
MTASSLSQAQVHETVRDEVVKSDADLICSSFARQPARWLTEWNFPAPSRPGCGGGWRTSRT